MQGWSAVSLLLAVCLGVAMLRPGTAQYRLRLAHGIAGGAGLVLLLVRLRRGASSSFAVEAAVLVGCGFLIGCMLGWYAWSRRRPPGLAIVLHATLAGLGALLAIGIAMG